MEIDETKRKLTIEEQIAHLKAKGVKFTGCSESVAKTHLAEKNNYFRLAAFRKLFPKHKGGSRDGQYIDLDFAQLQGLSYIDQNLRSALLAMSLDVEHYTKVAIISEVTKRSEEDGYGIVRDYKASLDDNRLKSLESELETRQHDVYCGGIIKKYRDSMPVWVFLEIVPFGRFVDFCRFCSERWSDKALLDKHYMLKKAKSVRNASAHGSCLMNGFAAENARKTPFRTKSRGRSRNRISRLRHGKSDLQTTEWPKSQLFYIFITTLFPMENRATEPSRCFDSVSPNTTPFASCTPTTA